MAAFRGSPQPLMGRYTLLPSASSWETVSEEAEGGLPLAEGMVCVRHCCHDVFS